MLNAISSFLQGAYSILPPQLLQALITIKKYKLFEPRTVKSLLWGENGNLGLFTPVSDLNLKNKTKQNENKVSAQLLPLELSLARFLPQYNGTTDGRYNVYTGEDNINKVGKIERWNGNE